MPEDNLATSQVPTDTGSEFTRPDFANNPLSDPAPAPVMSLEPAQPATESAPVPEQDLDQQTNRIETPPVKPNEPLTTEANEDPDRVDEQSVLADQSRQAYLKELGFIDVDGDSWAMRAEDSAGNPIVYRNIDDLRTAVQKKQEFIVSVTKERDSYEARVADRERQIKLMQSQMGDVDIDKIAIRNLMDELFEVHNPALKGLALDDLDSEEDKALYHKFRGRAEVAYEQQKEHILRDEDSRTQSLLRADQAAATEYRQRMSAATFGASNTEERDALAKFLVQDSGEIGERGDPVPVSEFIFYVLRDAPKMADFFINGVKDAFWNGYSPSGSNRQAPRPNLETRQNPNGSKLQETVFERQAPPASGGDPARPGVIQNSEMNARERMFLGLKRERESGAMI